MNWKKWPYWAKGGTIGLIIVVAAVLFATRNFYDCVHYKPLYDYPAGGDNSSYLAPIPPSCLPSSYFGLSIVGLGTIVISSFLGWLYGKIRGKSKMKDQISKL